VILGWRRLKCYDLTLMLLNSERVARWSALTAIALFFILSATQAYKPLQLDSADLPAWAAAVAETGKPIAYRGEDRPANLYVYHTPLYLYALGGWFKLFGVGPSQVRLFGALCAVMLGLITFWIFHTLMPASVYWIFTTVFWPLFLLNPYTIQGAAIADMDTTIYGPLLCGFLLCLVRLSWRHGEARVADPAFLELMLCSLLLALCLWTKLTTVLLFLPLPFFLLWPRFGFFRAIWFSAVVVVTGISLFLLTFVIWCKIVGAQPLDFWHWLVSYVATRGSSGQAGLINRLQDFKRNFLFMGPFSIKWTGLVPWAAAIAAFGYCASRTIRRRDWRAYTAAVAFGVALLGSIYYAGQQLSFGSSPFKYNYVFWGIICAGAAYLYASFIEPETGSVQAVNPLMWVAIVAIFGGAVALGAIRVTDRTLWSGASDFAQYWPYWLLPTLIFCAIACAIYKRKYLLASLAVMLFAFHIGLQLGIVLYQVRQTYSTTYNYAQSGLDATACYLRSVTEVTDIIGSMKDLGPLAQRRYYENYGYIYSGPKGADDFSRLLVARKIRYAVFTETIGEDQLVVNTNLRDWIEHNCRLVRSIGNYRIYELASK
jgi:hypothetical protein